MTERTALFNSRTTLVSLSERLSVDASTVNPVAYDLNASLFP